MLHVDATYNVGMRYNSVDIQNILFRRLDLHVHLTCMFIDKQYMYVNMQQLISADLQFFMKSITGKKYG